MQLGGGCSLESAQCYHNQLAELRQRTFSEPVSSCKVGTLGLFGRIRQTAVSELALRGPSVSQVFIIIAY